MAGGRWRDADACSLSDSASSGHSSGAEASDSPACQHTSAYARIRQHTSAYYLAVVPRPQTLLHVSIRQQSAYVRMRPHTLHTNTLLRISIRQHTSAYGRILCPRFVKALLSLDQGCIKGSMKAELRRY